MYNKDECVYKCTELMTYLDQDFNEIELGLKGDLVSAYRTILVQEKEVLIDLLHSIQKYY